ncbi:SDR family NAD(P)-dependent oxidoreductase [Streptomyces sp. NPDC093546]|uniref:SDR family NAD(P)-dependent oxidoreductase n=1 Tax=Streptomyces sp. NPDC093546 TaxID=3366040 RepID=UPI003812C09F
MDLGLKGRTAIVTGGSNGIGAAIAQALGAEGAHVVVGYHRAPARADEVVRRIQDSGGEAVSCFYALDDSATAHRIVETALDTWGRLDVVVANAVRWWGRGPGGFETLPEEEAERIVSDNLLGAIRLVRAAAPALREGGWGRIALVSSNLVQEGIPGAEYYAAAKGGLHGLCRSLAWSLGRDGTLANVVMPGLTMTERNLANFPVPLRTQETRQTPAGRLIVPEDIADTVTYLCSEANRGITGEVVPVTGGR